MGKLKRCIDFIKEVFQSTDFIPLHEPCLTGREKEFVIDCLDSTFVSTVGKFVDDFEQQIIQYTGANHAVATVNGTAALHVALLLAGVEAGDEVLTQAVSFVATANAINYCGAQPVFLDSDLDRLGMSPDALEKFLVQNVEMRSQGATNRGTGRRIVACVPMHVFGHPVHIERIKELCDQYEITLIEDAAESLGSFSNGLHTGNLGILAILSFNGNKTITTGGGGMILTNDDSLAQRAKHITTTSKIPHPWDYFHDQVGFNYRLPNINAALGCAQMELLPGLLEAKRLLAQTYKDFFDTLDISFVQEPNNCRSNYWLNAIILSCREERDEFLSYASKNNVMMRPLWILLSDLPMYNACQNDGLQNARWLQERLLNIPSSVTL